MCNLHKATERSKKKTVVFSYRKKEFIIRRNAFSLVHNCIGQFKKTEYLQIDLVCMWDIYIQNDRPFDRVSIQCKLKMMNYYSFVRCTAGVLNIRVYFLKISCILWNRSSLFAFFFFILPKNWILALQTNDSQWNCLWSAQNLQFEN